MKGLVTYDRKTRKDSFYFYKASWSKEPFIHLCGSRYVNRPEHLTSVKVYSNAPAVTLYVNDQKFQTLKGSRIFLFAEVPLNGTALIKAKAATGICDEMILKYTEEADQSYTYPKKQSGNVANWFIENIDKDQISAEGYFSVNDRIMELMANEEALKVLEEYLPAAVHDERTKMFGGMTLLRVIDRSHADLSQQQLKDLNQKLKQIKK
jgi:beta-galactosidase